MAWGGLILCVRVCECVCGLHGSHDERPSYCVCFEGGLLWHANHDVYGKIEPK